MGKKKPLVKEAPSESKENKENREKKGEREASKARPASSRKGKGGNRSRQGREAFRLSKKTCLPRGVSHAPTRLSVPASLAARPEENGVEVTPVEKGTEKGSERGRRQRGARGEHLHQTESRLGLVHTNMDHLFSACGEFPLLLFVILCYDLNVTCWLHTSKQQAAL